MRTYSFLTFILSASLTFAGDFSPPQGWELVPDEYLTQLGDFAIMGAIHEKKAMIVVLKEDVSDFETDSLDEFLKLKTNKGLS